MFLVHKQSSDTLWETYRQEAQDNDLLSNMLDFQTTGRDVFDPRHAFLAVRLDGTLISRVDTYNYPPETITTTAADNDRLQGVTIGEAIKQDIKLRILARLVLKLEKCIELDTSFWMTWKEVSGREGYKRLILLSSSMILV